MTTDAMIGLCFLVAGLLMMALLIGAALLKATKKPEPAPVQPVTEKGRPLARCSDCGRVVAVRKGDGMPYAGRHKCHVAEPAVTLPRGDWCPHCGMVGRHLPACEHERLSNSAGPERAA